MGRCDGLQRSQACACRPTEVQLTGEPVLTYCADRTPAGVIVDANLIGDDGKTGPTYYPLKQVPLNVSNSPGLHPICPLYTTYQNDYQYRGDPRVYKPYEWETGKEKCRILICSSTPTYFYGRQKSSLMKNLEDRSGRLDTETVSHAPTSAKMMKVMKDKDSEYMTTISQTGKEIMLYKLYLLNNGK